MKTPEQMALDYANPKFEGCNPYDDEADVQRNHCIIDFLAGYQAAKDTYKDAISVYEDVAKQMLEEAVRIMSPKDQLADADKVMPEWISVKERLPEIGEYVLVTHRTSEDYTSLKVMEATRISDEEYEIWGDHGIFADYVDYWMPMPKAPKEKK